MEEETKVTREEVVKCIETLKKYFEQLSPETLGEELKQLTNCCTYTKSTEMSSKNMSGRMLKQCIEKFKFELRLTEETAEEETKKYFPVAEEEEESRRNIDVGTEKAL